MKRAKCFFLSIVFICLFIASPHILAERTLFGVSEDFFRAMEQQKAFEKYLADNSFTLDNSFPYLQYNLLPLLPDLQYLSSVGPVLKEVNLQVISTVEHSNVLETDKGKIVQQFSLLSKDMVDLVLYKKEESETVFGLRSITDKYELKKNGEYSIEAQSTFWEGFTVFYGYDARRSTSSENLGIKSESRLITQKAGLEFNILPGMSVNADYKKTLKDAGLMKAQSTFNLAITPGPYASFSAGYGVITTDSYSYAMVPAGLTLRDKVGRELDDVIVKQLKMALYPTTYSRLSADYVLINEKGEPVSSSKAIFGLRLGDDNKEFNATYELANEDDLKTTTSAGLELGFVDQASLKAVYSKVEEHQITNDVLKSILNLGLNFNLAENSSLYFLYKWVLPDYEPDKEQKAEAKLEIRF